MQQRESSKSDMQGGFTGPPVARHGQNFVRWAVYLLVVLACVAPSAWINVKAQMDMGAGSEMIAAVVGFALLAPILTLNSAECIRTKKWTLAGAWGLLAAVFIVLNTVLALGGYSAIRDKVMDARAAQMRQNEAHSEQLTRVQNQIDDLRKEVGSESAEMIAAAIAGEEAKRIYERSGKCSKVTLDDSEAFCAALAGERRKLAAAREIARLEAEIERNGWRVSTATETPAAADPQIENLTALTMVFFGFRMDQRLMAAILSVFLALMTEILADVGPVAILFMVRSLRDRPAPYPAQDDGQDREQDGGKILAILPPQDLQSDPAQKALENKADPVAILARMATQDEARMEVEILPPDGLDSASLDDVKSWLASCLDPTQDDGRIGYGEAHEHLAAWCKARRKKVVPKSAFSLAMKSLGWPDKTDAVEGAKHYRAKVGGKMWFYGVALKAQPTLTAIK